MTVIYTYQIPKTSPIGRLHEVRCMHSDAMKLDPTTKQHLNRKRQWLERGVGCHKKSDPALAGPKDTILWQWLTLASFPFAGLLQPWNLTLTNALIVVLFIPWIDMHPYRC